MKIFSGRVIRGEHLGRKFGFPTANLSSILIKKHKIPFGIYAVWIILDKKQLRGILIAGRTGKINPERVKLEVFIFDWHKSLYNKKITVQIVRKIRPIIRFKTIAALRQQVKKDIKKTKAILK